MRLFKIAFRNLTRQWRRTLLVGFMFAFAASSLVVNAGVANGINRMIDGSVQRYLTGNVLIKSGRNEAELGKLHTGKIAPIADWREVERILEGRRDINGVLKRVSYSAIISKGKTQAFATVYGMEEKGAGVIPYALKAGEPLGSAPGGILLSPKQAEKLGARIGDELTLTGLDLHGTPRALPLKVKGIVSTAEFDIFRQTEVHVSYQDAQELFGLGGAPTEYLLAVSGGATAAAAAELAGALGGYEVKVQPWDVAGQEFLKSKAQLDVSVAGIFALFGVVIAAILFNMVQMQVHERIREIGTMGSLGMTWPQILGVLLLETFGLGLCASLVGAGGTYVAVRALGANGIAWGEGPAAIFGGTVLVPNVGVGTVLLFIGALTLLGVAGALYPAFRGARVAPADSLRMIKGV
ncbi:MAG: FtsX-like permease family protein [Actinobacteria bacterium]|nr:FtsX-like permease family protein [Actinomycetota bacterium]